MTTILTVRHQGKVALGGDGQVTLGNSVMKADANKIRKLTGGNVLCGFAGSSADAFALLERFESKLKDNPGNMPRAATELAKEWRTDRALRRLEGECTCPPNLPVCGCGAKEVVEILTSRPVTASEEEVQKNPRSRSAKLRVAEKK